MAPPADGLRRSFRLMRAFTLEQRAPERFYTALAADSVTQVSRYVHLAGARVLDVGGGPGWFADAFERAGARYCSVEAQRAELATATAFGPRRPATAFGPRRPATAFGPRRPARALVADGAALPFRSESFDVCFSSNVLEHVRAPRAFLDELVRTVRPGGIVFCAFTNWWSPWGGHETSPWHVLGGEWAAQRYERRRGHPPKNRFGVTLFPLHIGQVLRWAREEPRVELVDSRPRYLPSWCRPIVSVPGLREVATWNLATVLRRR